MKEEIADSGTLADQLKRSGPLPVADAVDVVLGLIAGLEAAHADGVLHRDVKPSNVFVNPDGSVKVGDYGLSVSTVATVDSFATATGIALGTPAYAAPEQLRGDELDVPPSHCTRNTYCIILRQVLSTNSAFWLGTSAHFSTSLPDSMSRVVRLRCLRYQRCWSL